MPEFSLGGVNGRFYAGWYEEGFAGPELAQEPVRFVSAVRASDTQITVDKPRLVPLQLHAILPNECKSVRMGGRRTTECADPTRLVE